MRLSGGCLAAAGALLCALGCGSSDTGAGDGTSGGGPPPPPDTTADVFGAEHAGTYHNGPVDFAETMFHNACAPSEKYPPQIQQLYGPYLAGVDNGVGGNGGLCDACALVKTPMGKSVVVHIVTYGQSNAAGDMDLSPEAFAVLQEGSDLGMRSMTWQLARCPDKGNMYIEYQTGSNPYWTSFWVRNAKVPIASVESKKAGEGAFTMLNRTPDGPFTDGDGVGTDTFDLRITSVGGQAVTQTFTGVQPGATIASTVQFP